MLGHGDRGILEPDPVGLHVGRKLWLEQPPANHDPSRRRAAGEPRLPRRDVLDGRLGGAARVQEVEGHPIRRGPCVNPTEHDELVFERAREPVVGRDRLEEGAAEISEGEQRVQVGRLGVDDPRRPVPDERLSEAARLVGAQHEHEPELGRIAAELACQKG